MDAKLHARAALGAALLVFQAALATPGLAQDDRLELRASEVLGNAAIPAMLIVLGIQVASSRAFTDLRAIGGSVALRLVVSAFIAYGLVRLLGLDGLTGDVLIVVAGMPTAVFTIILAGEYGGRPELASSMVVVSTVLSLVSVTVLLTLVGAG